jgi:hypothetical protein
MQRETPPNVKTKYDTRCGVGRFPFHGDGGPGKRVT